MNMMKKNQSLFIILGVVIVFLGYEFLFRDYSTQNANKNKKDSSELDSNDTKNKINIAKNKTAKNEDKDLLKDFFFESDSTETKLSVEDSIAQIYASSIFRTQQLKFQRVREAYKNKKNIVNDLYKSKKLDEETLQIYIRAFKEERELEVWAKDKNNDKFILLNKYKICETSGELGPKRKAGDNQIPEGFYHIDRFNPKSNFLISLGLNYPNKADKILADSTDAGKDIFIHGGCETVGGLPLTNDKIQEVYVMAVDAKAAGQKKIAVTIFPAHLTNEKYNELKKDYSKNPKLLKFWKQLKEGYNAFEKCKTLPDITINEKGEYKIKTNCK
jgi:murein L,D-transpeptidase YafK